MKTPQQITIYGAGYVGLVTAVCFAELGNQVLVVDVNPQKIQSLEQGICPFYEPELEQYLQRQLSNHRLSFSTDLTEGVAFGFFQFIAVGTPAAPDGSADIQQVFVVAQAIAQNISEYRMIVNKSTSPLGTVRQIQQKIQNILQHRGVDVEFDIVANPEFLSQGAAIRDFMQPDRIIVGVDNDRSRECMHDLYAAISDHGQRLIVMDVSSAELTKYAANAYLALRISFMNEMSHLAEYHNADIDLIRQGMGSDRRIGPHFLYAGCGFGGSCFPKDVSALKKMAHQINYSAPILTAIETVNQRQKLVLFDKISRYFNDNLTDKVIAVWGLAFKPNTDDMREASSRVLIDALVAKKAKVRAYDPAATAVANELYRNNPQIKICSSAHEALEQADVLAIVTEWNEFRQPDFQLIREKLRQPAVFDGRNLYTPDSLALHGLKYFAIGRGEKI